MVVGFNNAVLAPLFSLFNVVTGALTAKTEQSELPSFPVYLCQVFLSLMCEDMMFYWCHRLLHQPWIYPYIHKMHYEFYDTICLSSEYAHPVEFVIGNLIPLGLGTIILNGHGHQLSFLVFVTLRLFETVESHGGYDFPWAITRCFPFSVTSKYHNYHHLKNMGNYGSFLIMWDSICGTNSHYYDEILHHDKDFSDYNKKTN